MLSAEQYDISFAVKYIEYSLFLYAKICFSTLEDYLLTIHVEYGQKTQQ